MTKATYRPQMGDPINTKIECLVGIGESLTLEFAGNIPTEIPKNAYILQMRRDEKLNEDGLPRARAIEVKVPVAQVLAGNPYFVVEGDDGAIRGEILPPKKGRPANPKTPQEYRAWAQAWFADASTHTELADRWQKESALRAKLGVHDDGDDVHFLQPLYESRYHQLKHQAAA